MTIFLRSIVFFSPRMKTLALLRAKWTAGNVQICQLSNSSITTKYFDKTRKANLTGCSAVRHQYESIAKGGLIGQISSKPSFRGIYLSATFIPNDLRAYTPSWVPTKLFHSIAQKNKEEGLTSDNKDSEKSTNLLKKLKLMIKRYWYIYIPVHGITSIIWFGGFYYAVKSGWDFEPYLQKMGNFQWLLDSLENSNMGYYAIAAALYKIITPVRYAVTAGGIAASVKILERCGYIKANNITKAELHYIYQDKKVELIDKTDEMRQKYKFKKVQLFHRYQRKRDEVKRKHIKRIIYLRNIYSARRRDTKKKNGNGRKNSKKPNNGSRNGNINNTL